MRPVIRTSTGENEITLRLLRVRDRKDWDEVRRENKSWLTPWEATRPQIEADLPLPTYPQMIRIAARDARDLRSLSLGIWVKDRSQDRSQDRFVGQITLGGIVFGAYRGGYIGYWIDNRYANKGVVTHAVMALTEYAFKELSLHRIEITMRPENAASQRVAEKAGFIYEGLRLRYLHIDGQWRDHMIFVKENPEIR